MSEDGNELSVDTLPDEMNPFINYRTIAERNFGDISVQVTTDGVDISKEQADRLISNTHKAVTIAQKINKGPIEVYESNFTLRFPKDGMVVLMNDFKANKKLLNEDDKTQTAVVIHELVHAIEEEIPGYYGNNQPEVVTLASEFMFSGKSSHLFFLQLTDKVIEHVEDKDKLKHHAVGWRQSIQLISEVMDIDIDLNNESAEATVNKLEKVKNLEESEKITLVQNFIEQGKRNITDKDN